MKKTSYRLGLLAFVAALAAATSYAAELDKVLAQMDAAAAKFQNAQADFAWDNYTKVVDDHEMQKGTIYFERAGGRTQMAALVEQPTKKTVVYKDATLSYYDPSLDQLNVFAAGKNKAQYESFLTLGFGGSGTELAKTWNIKDDGPETIEGVATEKLELTGKDPSVSNLFKLVTIWIDPIRGVSLKQIFLAPDNDSRTATYTNIKLNTKKIDKAPYAISKSAKRIQH